MKLKEIYIKWFEFKQDFVKTSSSSAYMLLCENHIVPYFGENEKITECDVQDFILKKLKDGLSQKTVKDILIVLKMILKFGAKRNLIDYEKFDDLIFPSDHTKSDIEILNHPDYRKLVTHVKENFSFRSLGVLITITTGLRIGEVCGLKWSDIDIAEGYIKIRRTIQRIYKIDMKTGDKYTELLIDTPKTKNSIRDIPLNPDLLKIFKTLEKIVNPDFYILTNSIKPTEPRTYRNYYKILMKELELPVIKFHGLRHTFATQCISAKVDVKTVSVLLGHSNISTTFNLYVHPDMNQKKTAINQLFKAMK